MTKHDIAKLYKELGGTHHTAALQSNRFVFPDGKTIHENQIKLGMEARRIPSEEQCRELLESLLPEGWVTEMRWNMCGAWVNLYPKIFETDKALSGDTADTPGEAYLLAAKWLKEQAEPRPGIHLTLTHDGIAVIDDARLTSHRLDIKPEGWFTLAAEGCETITTIDEPPAPKFKVGDLVVTESGKIRMVTDIRQAHGRKSWHYTISGTKDSEREIGEHQLRSLDEAIAKLKDQV